MDDTKMQRCRDTIARLERYIDRCYGVSLAQEFDVTSRCYSNEKDRWDVWAASQIHWVAKELLQSRNSLYHMREAMKYAFRGLMLAREYQGRRGGFLTPPIDEELTNMRNVLEGMIEG